MQQIYNELEKENSNINSVLDHIESEEIQNHLTEIMAEDYGILDNKKALEDIFKKYEQERLENRRDELLLKMKEEEDLEKKKNLGKELNDVIMQLVKIGSNGYKNFVQT